MKIAAYCRVSTDKEDQLNSLEAQKRFFEEYTCKNNHTLLRIYADEGISGTKVKNRREFQRLLQDAQNGHFEMVVVKDISRFARNTVDFLNAIRKLKSLGIETVFLTSNQTVLGNSEFILTIFGALAQEESAGTSKRIKFGKKLNAQKGRVPNLVFGYNKTKGDYFSLTINDFEANVIRRIFNLYIDGGYGTSKIAQILNEEGSKTKRGCNWSQNAVSRILTNEIYTGKIINGKEEVADFLTGIRCQKDEAEWLIAEKPELRIIEDELFQKAAKILSSRVTAFNVNRQRQSNKYLFSTLIKCGCCGHSFRRIEREYKNTYIKWVCSGRNINGASTCGNVIKIDEKELTEAIRNYFVVVLNTKADVMNRVKKEFNRIYHTKDNNSRQEKLLSDLLAKAQKSRVKYMDMYDDDLITREELQQKIRGLNSEINKLENDLKLIKYNLGRKEQLDVILAETFTGVESALSTEFMSNSQLKRYIEKIVVNQEGRIDIYLRLFSEIGLNDNILIN